MSTARHGGLESRLDKFRFPFEGWQISFPAADATLGAPVEEDGLDAILKADLTNSSSFEGSAAGHMFPAADATPGAPAEEDGLGAWLQSLASADSGGGGRPLQKGPTLDQAVAARLAALQQQARTPPLRRGPPLLASSAMPWTALSCPVINV